MTRSFEEASTTRRARRPNASDGAVFEQSCGSRFR